MNNMNTHDIKPSVDVKLAIDNAKNVTCECGGMIYQKAFIIKEISALLSGTGSTEIMPIEVIVCKNCGKIPSQLMDQNSNIIPSELISKPQKINII